MKVHTNDTVSFKTGLTVKILKDINRINIKDVEKDFAKIGVDAKFNENKFVCASSVLVANILQEISSKYKLPFDTLPPSIRTYVDKNLIENNPMKCYGFSPTDTKKFLLDEPPFVGGSIFINDLKNKSAVVTDIRSTYEGIIKKQSSTHFLHSILHEWYHCIHFDLIFNKHGYEGNCPILKEKYYKPDADGLYKIQNKDTCLPLFFIKEVQKFTRDYISRYALSSTLYSELFSELMTKLTVNSLNQNLSPTKNPLDNLPKQTPKIIKDFIEETLSV